MYRQKIRTRDLGAKFGPECDKASPNTQVHPDSPRLHPDKA